MDLSIVIVNYNVRDFLIKCLQSIYGTTKGTDFEVIVVDNASSDNSVEGVKKEFPEVKIIANSTNRGFAAANNQAIKIARGKYILMLNPDTMVLNESIIKMMSFLDKNSDVGICGAKLLNPDNSVQSTGYKFPTLSRLFKSSILGTHDFPSKSNRPVEVDWLQGSCMMIRKKLIQDMGYLDEKFFMYGEEKDLCFRAKKAGWRIFSIPDPQVIHYAGKSTLDCEAFAFVEYHRSQHYFLKKHYPGWFRLLAKVILFIGVSRTIIVGSVFKSLFPKGDWGKKIRIYKSVLGWYLFPKHINKLPSKG